MAVPVACALLSIPSLARAGGISLSNVTIDGRPVGPADVVLVRGTESSLCFAVEGYSYSARPDEDAYVVFAMRSVAKPPSMLK